MLVDSGVSHSDKKCLMSLVDLFWSDKTQENLGWLRVDSMNTTQHLSLLN